MIAVDENANYRTMIMAIDDEEFKIVNIFIFYPEPEQSVYRQVTFVSFNSSFKSPYIYIVYYPPC